jgi:hypothetical protein
VQGLQGRGAAAAPKSSVNHQVTIINQKTKDAFERFRHDYFLHHSRFYGDVIAKLDLIGEVGDRILVKGPPEVYPQLTDPRTNKRLSGDLSGFIGRFVQIEAIEVP